MGYYSETGAYPCKACERGTTTKGRGASTCEKGGDNDGDGNDNKDEKARCPEGTEWVEDDKAKGCRALCKLGTYSKTGAWPCRKCPSGTMTKTPGSSECVEDPSLDPTKDEKPCPEGHSRVTYGRMSKCLPECKAGEYSRTGAVPCRNCPEGYKTDGAGATTCVKETGSGGEEDKKDCPEGTKYVTEDERGSGCRPECRPGSYSSTGLYPCKRCPAGSYTKESGAKECTEYPKTCPEGTKKITKGDMTKCVRECAMGYYSETGAYPCKACERGFSTYKVGSQSCVRSDGDNRPGLNNNDPKSCPEGTEWVRDSKTDGCRPLCRLGWYNKSTGAWPCRKCPSGTTTETPGSIACVEDAYLDPKDGYTKEECHKGYARVVIGWDTSSKCMRECEMGEFSRSGVVPCKPCKAGYSTRGPGATTCIKDAPSFAEKGGSSFHLDKYGGKGDAEAGKSAKSGEAYGARRLNRASVSRRLYIAPDAGSGEDIPNEDKQCAEGTIWKERTADHPAGCKPQCRPGTYSANGIYPCHSCKVGYTTKSWGERECRRQNEMDKGCPEGMKWFADDNGDGFCIKDVVCPRTYYSADGSTPCKACPEGTTTYTVGAKYCSDKGNQHSDDDSSTDDATDDAHDDDSAANQGDSGPTKCPFGTMWVEAGRVKGCRPLCKLGYYSQVGAAPCTACSSGKTTDYVGATSCIEEDPSESCRRGEKRVILGRSAVCRAECSKNTWSETGVAPCTPCTDGFTTEGSGATTCIKALPGGDPDKECPAGTKYIEKTVDDKPERGCIPLCDVDYYSATGTYPCSRCGHGTTTHAKGAIGEDSCVAKGEGHGVEKCPEGMKWIVDRGNGICIKKELCPRRFYSSDGYVPCSRCEFGTTSKLHG